MVPAVERERDEAGDRGGDRHQPDDGRQDRERDAGGRDAAAFRAPRIRTRTPGGTFRTRRQPELFRVAAVPRRRRRFRCGERVRRGGPRGIHADAGGIPGCGACSEARRISRRPAADAHGGGGISGGRVRRTAPQRRAAAVPADGRSAGAQRALRHSGLDGARSESGHGRLQPARACPHGA